MDIRITLIAVALVAGIASASAAGVTNGQGAKLKDQVIACPTVNGLLSMVRETDPWKAGQVSIKNRCVVFDKDEMVRVAKGAGTPFTCFTTKDYRDACLWVPSDFVGPVE